MKLVIAIVCSAVLYANDVANVDSIIKNIENLRIEHSACQKKSNILEKQVEKLKNTLLSKENSIKNLTFEVSKLEKKHENSKHTVLGSANQSEKTQKVSPATFRLKRQSYIYDSVNGVRIATWHYKKTFTSDTQTENWVKITGFFVKKEWKEAERELWIKKENITKRLNK